MYLLRAYLFCLGVICTALVLSIVAAFGADVCVGVLALVDVGVFCPFPLFLVLTCLIVSGVFISDGILVENGLLHLLFVCSCIYRSN